MATQAVPALREIPVGTPVEISSELAPQVRRSGSIFTEAKYALFTGYGKHYEPNKTYANLLVQDTGTTFKHVIVSVPMGDLGFAPVKPSRAKMLDKLFKAYTKANMRGALEQMLHGILGSDPEIFVRDSKTGEIIPSWLFLKSKEEQPKTVRNMAFWDGFQGEFTVAPSYCNDLLVGSIRHGLLAVYNQSKAYSPDAVLSIDTVVEVPQNYLRDAEDKHVMFGCMPSKNVYGTKGEHAGSGRSLPLRFAGGHIHFSGFNKDDETIRNTVKALDAILGVLSVPIFKGYDNPVRRNYYGLAGEYRTPEYGMEYRTLSNAWLCHPAIAHLTLDLARTCSKFANAKLNSVIVGSEQLIQDIVNQGDINAANKYIKKNKDLFTALFKFTYRNTYPDVACSAIFKLIDEGIDALFETPRDIEKNWALNSAYETWEALFHSGRVQWNRAGRTIAAGKKV